LITSLTSFCCSSSGRFVTVDHQEGGGGEEGDDDAAAAAQRGGASSWGVLLSPVLDQDEWSCLRLVYQISGAGSLEVQLRSEGSGADRPLWSSQSPSDSWVISSMDLPNTTEPYRVKWLAYSALIAIHILYS